MTAAAILGLLFFAAAAWVFWPRGLLPLLRAQWRAMPRAQVAVLLLALAACTWYGADKGEVAQSSRVAQMLTVMADGELRGATNVVANAVAGAAVQAVLDESDDMLATASNAVAWVQSEITLLEDAITNTAIAWLQSEIPAPLDGDNPVARADIMQAQPGTNGIMDVYVAFSLTPSTAPLIGWEACSSNGIWTACTAVSNSFPTLLPVATPSGVTSCYVYTVSVPAPLRDLVLLPEREITFGGGSSNTPLSVLGGLMVDDRLGVTGSRTIAPGVLGTFEGGALVEVSNE